MRSRGGLELMSRLPAQVTSFVDRERELAEILSVLAHSDSRLLTLTGPGGVGKTHLALRVAAAIAREVSTPELYWISLAPMERAEQLAHAIGEAFELKGSDSGSLSLRLAVTLLERRVLLLLDNFEHLRDAAPLIAELINACPTLTLLVTSRGPLHLSGEWEITLEPLVVPAEIGQDEEVEAAPAVQLFLQRVPIRFETEPPNQEQLQAISAICRRLDGLPLAIELAAAWCRLLTPSQLLMRLDRSLPMLTDGPVDAPVRLQTMRAAVGWSFALLDEREQELFRTLCIFAGGFTLEAAEYLARSRGDPTLYRPEDSGATIKGLAQLVNRGLVRAPVDGRFTMLQTIREFGLELLTATGELDEVRRAHLAWCASLVGEPAYEPLDGYIWSAPEFASEQIELSAALGFALDLGDLTSALQLASGLAPIWAEQGRYAEARSALEAIARGSPLLDPGVRAIVIGWEAEWAWLQGDYRSTWNLASEALEACRSLNMEAGIAANLYRMGRVATLSDPSTARPLLQEALTICQSTGDDRPSCWCQLALGHVAITSGDWEGAGRWFGGARQTLQRLDDGRGAWLTMSCALAEAQLALIAGDDPRAGERLRAALAESRAQHNLFYESLALVLSCQTLLRQNNVASAAAAGREGLQIAQQLGHLLRQRQCLDQLSSVAIAANQLEPAALLHGAAITLGERIQGIGPIAAVDPWRTDEFAPDELLSDELIWIGRRYTDADTLAEVLALERDIDQRQEVTTNLSKRELEVLALLAKGETNSAIADRLFVGTRTVDSHVGSILRKLDVTSRFFAIEAARERGLLNPDER
jgi:predicted ATPase/DNA-binding CsgD family transcriptional regulator